MDISENARLDMPYAQALPRVKEAFAAHGFGTLTEIDVQATLKQKLDNDMERYTILGVCNPGLAQRALDTDRDIGLLLPCTVVVRAVDDATLVEALDPAVMVEVSGDDRLRPVADEAAEGIRAAMAELSG